MPNPNSLGLIKDKIPEEAKKQLPKKFKNKENRNSYNFNTVTKENIKSLFGNLSNKFPFTKGLDGFEEICAGIIEKI
jgi:hypothetical protein